MKQVVQMEKDMGKYFIQSLDKLVCYKLVNILDKFHRDYGTIFGSKLIRPAMRKARGEKDHGFISQMETFYKKVKDFEVYTEDHSRLYNALVDNFKGHFTSLLDPILQVGQLQIIRKILLRHLSFISKMESPQYYSSVKNLNHALFSNIEKLKEFALEIKDVEEVKETEEERLAKAKAAGNFDLENDDDDKPDANPFGINTEDTKGIRMLKNILMQVSEVMENCGEVETQNKVFLPTCDIDYQPLVFFLITLTSTAFLQYDVNVNSITRRTKEKEIDGPPLVMGLITLFKQFHFINFKKYMLIVSHFVKGQLLTGEDKKTKMP